MKAVIALSFLIAVVAARPQDSYTTKYDGINIDEILKSDRLFNNYYKCLMDQGRCTPDGSELKRNLPDALKSECSKCSQKQKDGSEKILKFLIEKKPAEWKNLQQKYDPEDTYIVKFREQAKAKNIKI